MVLLKVLLKHFGMCSTIHMRIRTLCESFHALCIGDPLMFVDKVYTFLEIGAAAYDKEVFTSAEGWETLQRRSKPKPSSSVVKNAMKAANVGGASLSDLISKVQQDAASFRAGHDMLGKPQLPNSSQGLQQLLPSALTSDSIPVGKNVMLVTSVEHSTQGERNQDENKGYENEPDQVDLVGDGSDDDDGAGDNTLSWEERALIAESRLEAANMELTKTKTELNDLVLKFGVQESKLHSTEIMNAGFMAELDQKNELLSKFNEQVAQEIVSKLKPHFNNLSSIEKNVNTVVRHVTPVDGIPGNWKDSFPAFTDRVESNFATLSDGVSATNKTLTSYGLLESDNGLNIPETMQYISSMNKYHFKSMGTPLRDEPNDNLACMYELNGTDIEFVCKCGCGNEVHGSLDKPDDPSIVNPRKANSTVQETPNPRPAISTPNELIRKLGIDLSKPPPILHKQSLKFQPSKEVSTDAPSASGLQKRGEKRSVVSSNPVASSAKRAAVAKQLFKNTSSFRFIRKS